MDRNSTEDKMDAFILQSVFFSHSGKLFPFISFLFYNHLRLGWPIELKSFIYKEEKSSL